MNTIYTFAALGMAVSVLFTVFFLVGVVASVVRAVRGRHER